ncbi:DNA-dependent metalloprotease dvc-1 isoform X2 [Zerene cesonia]|uniref:DNA-dependent metalloprotease dvc-1 isoform X2 n=1 Tax=Zerene cesonia TaxID=33412 RepID=UPI0018E4DD73|nr:DNA-dependent metalloprotease dvc-1 isoform X2 [Zerene cesonia]
MEQTDVLLCGNLYDRGGLCDIALSEPLLKLRPRKDLVETLLHEMIHAFLFITCKDQDRDGHGPNFKSHMYRINKAAGLNISIYHDFHDEVKLYQTHWWRCNGPCQNLRPHFGIVRRPMNRAPGPNDYWWNDHRRKCGGAFVKIKEPEKPGKKKVDKQTSNIDITKYLNNNNNNITIDKNKGNSDNAPKPVLKDSNVIKPKSNNNIVFNPQVKKPVPFSSNSHTVNEQTKSNDSSNVIETVRNVWANKTLNMSITASSVPKQPQKRISTSPNIEGNIYTPPSKIKKIDDYFKSTATNMLKDLYGQDFSLTQSKTDEKLIAIPVQTIPVNNFAGSSKTTPRIDDNLVDCPICNTKVNSDEINKHLDECLSKDVIEELTQENVRNGNQTVMSSNNPDFEKNVEDSLANTKTIKEESIDLTNIWIKPVDKEYPMSKIDIKKEPNNKPPSFAKAKTQEQEVIKTETPKTEVKVEPGCSKMEDEHTCPCCGNVVKKTVEEHLDECLAFFDNNTTIPEEGASTSFADETIVIDDDIHDETLLLNETGTKSPCPCCMKMIEMADMNIHLDVCLLSD